MIIENLKIIMFTKMTRLLLLSNQDEKKVKTETEKMYNLFTCLLAEKITKLNELN